MKKALEVKQPNTLQARAKKYMRSSKAENTKIAYKSAFSDFREFCESQGRDFLPAEPQTVMDYLTFTDQQKVSTIQVKLAAIAEAHRLAHLPDPTVDEDVRTLMAGIRRELGTKPDKKTPLETDRLRKVISVIPDDIRGKRDRAMILMGFAGAFRRSELVAVDMKDISMVGSDVVAIIVRRSKTDQEGKGLIKHIPTLKDKSMCPVTALHEWLDESGIVKGAVFIALDHWGNKWGRLTPQSVALIIKKYAELAGLDPKEFSGHSLRSGFITSAAMENVPEWAIQKQTGHRSLDVLRGYIKDEGQGASNATRAAFGEV